MSSSTAMRRLVAIATGALVLTGVAPVAMASTGLNTTGLVGAWNLNEGSGTSVADSSGHGNNGVLSGDAQWVPGHEGAALKFNGGFAQVEVTRDSSLEPPDTVTVSAWVKNAGSPGDYSYILAKGATGCIAASYGLYTGPNGGIEFYISRSKGTVYARSPDGGTGIWDGNWHFVVGTFDGTTIRLYVDGVEVGSGTVYPGAIEYLLPDSNDLFIGNYPGCEMHEFVGAIDDVTVWERALSAAEVPVLMAAPVADWAPSGGQSSGTGGSGTGGSGTGGSGTSGSGTGGSGTSGSGTGGSGTSGSGTGGSGTSGSGTSGSGKPSVSSPGGSGTGTGHTPSRPAIGHLRLSPTTIATLDGRGTAQREKHPTAAKLTYTDTEASSLTITVALAESGVRQGRSCVKPVPTRSRGREVRCTRWVTVGSFRHSDRAGANSITFAGIPGRRLAPGAYLLELAPLAGSLRGATATIAFTIVRG